MSLDAASVAQQTFFSHKLVQESQFDVPDGPT